MSFTFTKNIKVAVVCTDGELVFEFKRPDNKAKNQFLAQQLDIKTDGAARLNDLDALRLAFFDQYIDKVYVDRDGTVEDIVDEDGKPMTPADFPDDIKLKAVARAFEYSTVVAKNF